jgi:NADPH:quinone reductase-like Zn-dependent oxidoreductase
MKALIFSQYGTPEVLTYTEIPDPTPQPGDVLIRVHATTVNRLDTFQRSGSRPVGSLPFIGGLEAAGVVLHDSAGFKAGERVMTSRTWERNIGGYAALMPIPAQNVVRIPDGVSFEQAAAMGLAASTAWNALYDVGGYQPGERVLITAGASGVGTIQVQLVKQSGGWAAATAGGAEKSAQVKSLGADLVVDHRSAPIGETVKGSGGVALAMENVSSTLNESIQSCLPGGRIVLIGNAGGREATVDTQILRINRVHLIGGGVGMRASVAAERTMLEGVAAGTLRPQIARVLPIQDGGPEAHRLIEGNQVFGKVVLLHPV